MTTTVPSSSIPTTFDLDVPQTPQTGKWQHPRLDEIVKRQNASTFSKQNIKKIIYNFMGLLLIYISTPKLSDAWPFNRYTDYFSYLIHLLQLALIYNTAVAIIPLFRQTDTFADISLTPAQRKLLGIHPAAAAPTPGSQYSTPPRYARTSTPLSGSPINRGKNSGFRSSGNESQSSRSMTASQFSPSTRFDASLNTARRLSETPATPTPSGLTGTLGVTNKWLYDKGRRNSGSSRLYIQEKGYCNMGL